jgi:hypothetical protein
LNFIVGFHLGGAIVENETITLDLMDKERHINVLKKLVKNNVTPYPASEWMNPADIGMLKYLEDHRLISVHWIHPLGDEFPTPVWAKITECGLDFLEKDGGLSAMLGVVTIKLHDDTIKALIGQKIEQSDLAPPDKRKWLDALRALPADATKHLTMKLLDLGLAHGPSALHAIQTVLHIGTK